MSDPGRASRTPRTPSTRCPSILHPDFRARSCARRRARRHRAHRAPGDGPAQAEGDEGARPVGDEGRARSGAARGTRAVHPRPAPCSSSSTRRAARPAATRARAFLRGLRGRGGPRPPGLRSLRRSPARRRSAEPASPTPPAFDAVAAGGLFGGPLPTRSTRSSTATGPRSRGRSARGSRAAAPAPAPRWCRCRSGAAGDPRGYHQAALLAARSRGRPAPAPPRGALRRMRETPPQVGRDRAERAPNVAGAFGPRGGRGARPRAGGRRGHDRRHRRRRRAGPARGGRPLGPGASRSRGRSDEKAAARALRG